MKATSVANSVIPRITRYIYIIMCLFNFPNKSSIAAKNKGIIEFECGSCPECLQKKSRLWALRCSMEAKVSPGVMVTLTYDTYKVLYGKTSTIEENPTDPTLPLSKRDCQLFIKRLRKHFEPKKIKYLITAERGKRTGRAHYHALLFGVQFDDLVKYKKSDRGNWIYKSRTLEKIWQNGICTVDCINLSAKTARYCTKYCSKDSGVDDTFMLFSRGIGEQKLLEEFNGKSYWIDGREYSIPKQIWQRVIESRYDCYGLSRYIPKVRLEDTEKKIFNELQKCKKNYPIAYSHFVYYEERCKKHLAKFRKFRKKETKERWYALDNKWNSYYEKWKNLLYRYDHSPKIKQYIDSLRRTDVTHQFGIENNQRYQDIRDNDPQYQAYLTYWNNKARQYEFNRPAEIDRILTLPDTKYRAYKTKAILAKQKQAQKKEFFVPRSKIQAFLRFPARKKYVEQSFAPLTRHYRANDTVYREYKEEFDELRSLRRSILLSKSQKMDTILEKDVYIWSFNRP